MAESLSPPVVMLVAEIACGILAMQVKSMLAEIGTYQGNCFDDDSLQE